MNMGMMQIFARQQGAGGPPPDPAYLAESRQPQMLIGNIVVQTIGCLFFFLRAYSRLCITKTWRTEDYLLLVAWLAATGYSTCQYGQIAHGSGRHLVALLMSNPQDPVTSQKYAYAAQILLFPALAGPKLSICSAYLRIFYTDVRGRRMIQGIIVVLVLSIIPFCIEVILQCKPIHVYWTEGRPASKCLDDLAGLFINGSLNVLADVLLMAIVLPRVIELKLHKRQRWALVGVVLLGTLAVVAGIIRMVRVSLMLRKPDFDPSWDSYDISIWTNTEIYVSLICAAAPGIKPVIVRLLPKVLGTSLKSRTRTTGGDIELKGSKWRHTNTIGSARLHKQNSQTALATAEGPYTECGRAGDDESWENKSGRASRRGSEDDGGIYKTSEISVQVSQHK